ARAEGVISGAVRAELVNAPAGPGEGEGEGRDDRPGSDRGATPGHGGDELLGRHSGDVLDVGLVYGEAAGGGRLGGHVDAVLQLGDEDRLGVGENGGEGLVGGEGDGAACLVFGA